MAPAAIALSMNLFPSLDSPRMATNASPRFTRRESYSIPLTSGFPLWERTSAPYRSCWKFMAVNYRVKSLCGDGRLGRLKIFSLLSVQTSRLRVSPLQHENPLRETAPSPNRCQQYQAPNYSTEPV